MKIVPSVNNYIVLYPKATVIKLKQLRAAIKKLAPQATEAISYGIPTFVLNGNLVHFAAYKTHIGFYPGASAIAVFKKDIAKYPTSKGTIQFPLDKPLPLALITKIVKFRIKENKEVALKKGMYREFPKLSAPAHRALANAKIKTLKDLSLWSESGLLKLHGIGPSTILPLRKALKEAKLSFLKK